MEIIHNLYSFSYKIYLCIVKEFIYKDIIYIILL
jgi:hypothetical protein